MNKHLIKTPSVDKTAYT